MTLALGTFIWTSWLLFTKVEIQDCISSTTFEAITKKTNNNEHNETNINKWTLKTQNHMSMTWNNNCKESKRKQALSWKNWQSHVDTRSQWRLSLQSHQHCRMRFPFLLFHNSASKASFEKRTHSPCIVCQGECTRWCLKKRGKPETEKPQSMYFLECSTSHQQQHIYFFCLCLIGVNMCQHHAVTQLSGLPRWQHSKPSWPLRSLLPWFQQPYPALARANTWQRRLQTEQSIPRFCTLLRLCPSSPSNILSENGKAKELVVSSVLG